MIEYAEALDTDADRLADRAYHWDKRGESYIANRYYAAASQLRKAAREWKEKHRDS